MSSSTCSQFAESATFFPAAHRVPDSSQYFFIIGDCSYRCNLKYISGTYIIILNFLLPPVTTSVIKSTRAETLGIITLTCWYRYAGFSFPYILYSGGIKNKGKRECITAVCTLFGACFLSVLACIYVSLIVCNCLQFTDIYVKNIYLNDRKPVVIYANVASIIPQTYLDGDKQGQIR